MVTSFQYLGRVISAADDDWPAVVSNLSQERVVSKSMTRILGREAAEPQVSSFFFKAFMQAVLIFVLDTWMFTPRMGSALGGFQDQVARRLTGRILWRKPYGKRKYTSADAAREEAGFQTVEE